jgi:N-acetylglucosaminyldiphosphoundecaprenol N-acetyl-beta-D-mannosaminyltransferase
MTAVQGWVHGGKPVLVANHNVNSLVLLQKDERFRRFYDRADTVFVDGVAVVVLGRLLGAPLHRSHRIAVLDWIWPLLAEAEAQGWSVVHVGGAQHVLDVAVEAIRARHPKVELTAISGFFDPLDPSQNDAVIERVRAAQPDVLLVGMGMPRQEAWLLANLDRLPSCVTMTVGGILSFLGNERPTAPRWVGTIGLEWLFRLVTEPRRLWRRYLVEPLELIPVVATELKGRRKRP